MSENPKPDAERLLPCPFCNGAVKVAEIDREEKGYWYSVECANEKCTVGPCMDIDLWPQSREEAIAAWNTRPAPDAANVGVDAEMRSALIEISRETNCAGQARYPTQAALIALNALDRENLHADDIAVNNFARHMAEKMAKSRSKGRGGWENKDECSVEYLSQLLVEHLVKGDPIDVANFCMMLHQRGERIQAMSKPAPEGMKSAEEWVATNPSRFNIELCSQEQLILFVRRLQADAIKSAEGGER